VIKLRYGHSSIQMLQCAKLLYLYALRNTPRMYSSTGTVLVHICNCITVASISPSFGTVLGAREEGSRGQSRSLRDLTRVSGKERKRGGV